MSKMAEDGSNIDMTASVARAVGQANRESQYEAAHSVASKFAPKKSYRKRDLLDTYEARRFDGPF